MKFWIALALAFALALACVSIPLGGRTVWGHARDHGVPQATARAVAAGACRLGSAAGTAWTWITARPEAGKGSPAIATKRVARRDETKPGRLATLVGRSRTSLSERDPAPPAHLVMPEAPEAPTPTGILAEQPAEKLSDTDKSALDRLVAKSAKHQ